MILHNFDSFKKSRHRARKLDRSRPAHLPNCNPASAYIPSLSLSLSAQRAPGGTRAGWAQRPLAFFCCAFCLQVELGRKSMMMATATGCQNLVPSRRPLKLPLLERTLLVARGSSSSWLGREPSALASPCRWPTRRPCRSRGRARSSPW